MSSFSYLNLPDINYDRRILRACYAILWQWLSVSGQLTDTRCMFVLLHCFLFCCWTQALVCTSCWAVFGFVLPSLAPRNKMRLLHYKWYCPNMIMLHSIFVTPRWQIFKDLFVSRRIMTAISDFSCNKFRKLSLVINVLDCSLVWGLNPLTFCSAV